MPLPRSSDAGLRALAITLAIQVFASLAGTATSVLAPEIARDMGVSPRLIGVFVGLLYIGSAIASLVSGVFIVRHGAIRVSQACVLLCAAGIALVVASGTWGAFAALAAIVIGVGYGPITPASSQVLARTTPPARMALIFSIKQTGVPAGAALAGAALPAMALALGWNVAFLAIAAVGVAVAAIAQTSRGLLDTDRAPARDFSLADFVAPIRRVLANAALAELAWVAFTYAATQVCLMSFLVVYLNESLGLSLVAAGFALTVTNAGGIVGRIAWGAVADRYARPRSVLAALGLVACACAWTMAALTPAWPTSGLVALCTLFGATAIGWNGVQLAEVARHAPPNEAGPITGATGFIGFGGVVVGPPLFALLSSLTGSYRTGFVAIGVASAICAFVLLRKRR